MPFTYILSCADGSYYVGSTRGDLQVRLLQHNSGNGARYTACRRPVTLAWCAEFDRVTDAFALEKQVQNWSRAKREALIQGRFGDLPGLARSKSSGLDRLDQPKGLSGLDRLDQPEGRSGLDRLDQPER